MLGFNTILKEFGVDPFVVQLVRHQQVGPDGITPYKLLVTSPQKFEDYQKLQGRRVFRGKFIAAFVVTPKNETLFANLYRVESVERNCEMLICPISRKEFEPDKIFSYNLDLDERLQNFAQRLTVKWGEGYRSWVQRAHRQNKDIIELRHHIKDDLFPGYDKFLMRLGHLSNIYTSWQQALSIQKGVYLLTFEDGQQYVGSATGAEGFWQRWSDYLKNGHGGNVALKGRDARDAMISILETSRLSETVEEILRCEALWHRKLGVRAKLLDRDDSN